jgi:hypothetical protein
MITPQGNETIKTMINLTAIGLTSGGNSTVHIYTNNTQNNTMKENVQNGTYITIKIPKYKNKNI